MSTYELIWEDDFNGDALNRAYWNVEVRGDGCGNNELQYYRDDPENVKVKDGNLVITARREWYLGKEYTSARINTSKKFSFCYGKIEFRAKLVQGKGMWPAFWLLPEDNVYGGWPLSGEIDVMEMMGQDDFCRVVKGAINYGDPWPHNKWSSGEFVLPVGSFADEFHSFAIEWEERAIKWYVDGIHYATKTPGDLGPCLAGPCPWMFDQRFHIIVNLAVGGNPVPPPDGQTVFPQELLLDYVRVYRRVGLEGASASLG